MRLRIMTKSVKLVDIPVNRKLFDKLLHYKMFVPGWTFEDQWKYPEDLVGDCYFVLGYQDRRMIGLAYYEENKWIQDYPGAQGAVGFYVNPDYRRHGIGKILASKLVADKELRHVVADTLARKVLKDLDLKVSYFY
jgi:GNAT superfamily N-acetyltransferase